MAADLYSKNRRPVECFVTLPSFRYALRYSEYLSKSSLQPWLFCWFGTRWWSHCPHDRVGSSLCPCPQAVGVDSMAGEKKKISMIFMYLHLIFQHLEITNKTYIFAFVWWPHGQRAESWVWNLFTQEFSLSVWARNNQINTISFLTLGRKY